MYPLIPRHPLKPWGISGSSGPTKRSSKCCSSKARHSSWTGQNHEIYCTW